MQLGNDYRIVFTANLETDFTIELRLKITVMGVDQVGALNKQQKGSEQGNQRQGAAWSVQ